MSGARHGLGQLALVLAVALAARAAFVIGWHATHDPHRFEFPDSESYWELGRDLATGAPYQFGASDGRILRAPGYPLLLAPLFYILGPDVSPAAARWLGAVIGTMTVGAVYWLARSMFDSRVGLLSGLIVAVYPETVATSILPLSDGPFCLWMILQLGLWHAASDGQNKASLALAFAAGVGGAVATLTRPSWLLFSPLIAVVWVVARQFDRRQVLLAAAMLIGLAVGMAPWWARSYQITGRFVATVLWVGPSLYDGLNPAADGSSNMDFVPLYEAKLRAADAANPPAPGAPPFEYRFDRLMRDEALAWAAAHPGRVLQLAAHKLGRMWNVWPNEPAFRSWTVRCAVGGSYVPLMALALAGGWQLRRRRLDLLLLVSPAIYFSVLHAVFVGSLRYRQPALLPLAILAAVALDAAVRRYRSPVRVSRSL